MSKNFEDAKLNLQNAEAAVEIYNNPAVKAVKSLLDKIPVIGALIDETTGYALQRFQDKKREEFIDIILSSGENITSDKVNDVEFLINFAKTVEAVDRLATNDKVKYFANLLKNGYFKQEKINADLFDEMLNSLNNLTLTQISIIVYWGRYVFSNDDKSWENFQNDLMCEFKLTASEFYGQLNSISKTGLCRQRGGFTFASEAEYELTDYYHKMQEYVLEKTNE